MTLSLEELGAFLHTPPPRAIPDNIKRQKFSGMLGRGMYWFGGIFAGFGLFFLVFFFPWRIVQELSLDLGHPSVTDGKVTRSDQTHMSEGGGDHGPGTPIFRIHFEFQPAGGPPLHGVCYCVGQGMQSGQAVTVQFQPYGRSFSRIQGCRVNAFGYGPIFVVLFPLVGFSAVGLLWRGRRRMKRLLSDGVFASGQITAVEKTNIEVNSQQRYKVTVAFEADEQQQITTYNAYGAEVTLAQQKLAAGEGVGLLYDPARPQSVLLVDSLLSE